MADTSKSTRSESASAAGHKTNRADGDAQQAAGSALSQKQGGQTGEEAGSAAGRTLASDDSTQKEKKAAASALGQKS